MFRFSGICSQPQQTQTYSGHSITKSGQVGRLPHQVPHGPLGRRAVQRRKGLPYKTDQRAQAVGTLTFIAFHIRYFLREKKLVLDAIIFKCF